MIKAAIEKILDMAGPKIVELPSGLRYTDRQGTVLLPDPEPKPLQFHTLRGIVDYLNEEPTSREAHFIHIDSYNSVSIRSFLINNAQQRFTYATATPTLGNSFPFGSWLDLEQFIIELQAKFERNNHQMAILKLLSSIRDENVKTSKDDGITQVVTARSGIALKADVEVPNPVSLKPYRTFVEIEQPGSDFIFRLKTGDKMPTASLHESGGGAWKIEAINAIKDFFISEGVKVPVIA